MSTMVNSEEGEQPLSNADIIVKLMRLVENSDLSFYQIASLVGTSGTILSMWLAGTAKPQSTNLDEIEKLLRPR
jgi:DNA transposition AAA+ family ATPase